MRARTVGAARCGVLLVVFAVANAASLHGQGRILRSGDMLPGIVVEESESDPDLDTTDPRERRYNENRRAVNRPPRLLKTVPSQYPEDLKGSGADGEVMVSLMVDRMGHASHIRVEQSPDELFTDAALNSLAQWEFLPALKNGRVSNSRVNVSITVSEEMGDSTYFDFPGGRISLEGITYAGAHEYDVKRIFGLRPVFPFEMLVDAKPGEVLMEFSIENAGTPYDVKILESTHKEFSLAAQAAMAHWRFSPALQEGNAVPARLRYRVSFQPDEYPNETLALARRMQDGLKGDFVPTKELDSPPKIVRSMTPNLPEGVEDRDGPHRVTVGIVVTSEGDVLLPRIEAAPEPLIGYAAATVVSYWKFSPGYRNRQPVQVNVSLPIAF
ncbi:MAG: TonB family protein [Opitutaceae bacterium]